MQRWYAPLFLAVLFALTAALPADAQSRRDGDRWDPDGLVDPRSVTSDSGLRTRLVRRIEDSFDAFEDSDRDADDADSDSDSDRD